MTSPMMNLWLSRRYHPWQTFFWQRQDLFNAILIWSDEPRIVEYRRPASETAARRPWSPVDPASLREIQSSLTNEEVRLLEGCLATPDGSDPMSYRGDRFANGRGDIVYPVRGKRVYCELAAGSPAR